MTQSRRPSPLQRRVLIVLAALDEKRPGPVLTRDIERVLERSGEAPGLWAKPACLVLSSGGCRLAAYPARSEHATGSGADGRQPGRGTASAAGKTGPPPGRTACGRSRHTAAGPGIRSARRRHFYH